VRLNGVLRLPRPVLPRRLLIRLVQP